MKKTAITIAALVAAALFMSCKDGCPDESENQNTPERGTTATANFDLNLPDSTKYKSGENAAISDITATVGTSITLPSTKCFYSEYTKDDIFIASYKFSCWNTHADGSGSNHKASDTFTLTQDITFYAQYEKEVSSSGGNSEDSENGKFLDIATTTKYSMKVGETIKLKSSWSEECYYEIDEDEYGFGAISLDNNNNTITGESIGKTTVKITSSTDSSKKKYCIITVTSDSFSGTGLDYKMIGKWTDGDSYIQLNSDYSGYMKVYLGNSVVQDVSLNWSTEIEGTQYKNYKYLTISNASDYLNKRYRIISVSSTTLKLKGWLAFGMPQETTWTKDKD